MEIGTGNHSFLRISPRIDTEVFKHMR